MIATLDADTEVEEAWAAEVERRQSEIEMELSLYFPVPKPSPNWKLSPEPKSAPASDNTMTTELQISFHAAMIEVYVRAKSEAGYTASRFLTMVTDQGGYEAARTLLHASSVSDGYTALWERKRLDLTVEAVILKPEWHDLFSEEERNIARERLTQYGYNVD